VGALTSKDFRFSTPTWFLKRTPSVCTTCARGCSIEIDVDSRDDKVKRLRPRHNPHVNGYWMCDEGRLNYKFVNTDRVEKCLVEKNGEKFESSLENALWEASEILGTRAKGAEKGAGSPAGAKNNAAAPLFIVVSATATLEEMFVCKLLSRARPGRRCLRATSPTASRITFSQERQTSQREGRRAPRSADRRSRRAGAASGVAAPPKEAVIAWGSITRSGRC
jgi:NADH dehydrogenase/NADH:ubiquinone oxidoreductase subunit G